MEISTPTPFRRLQRNGSNVPVITFIGAIIGSVAFCYWASYYSSYLPEDWRSDLLPNLMLRYGALGGLASIIHTAFVTRKVTSQVKYCLIAAGCFLLDSGICMLFYWLSCHRY